MIRIALLALGLVACSSPSAPQPATGTPAGAALQTLTVHSERVARETAFDGALEAVNQSTVTAQTSGRVEALPFDVGDFVDKGAIIVRLRDTEQQAAADSAQAALREAGARLAEAQQAFDRTRDVFEKKLVARAQLDAATANLNAAKARVESARAAVAQTREQLEYTVVRAPYSGIVVRRHVDLGESASVGKPLMTGLSLEHLRAIVEIPQQHVTPLRQHRQARVILPDGRSVEAKDLRIPPAADPATHTFRVLVTLPEGDHGAYPGSLVKVAFVSGEQERLLLPASAVVQRSELTGAYVVDQNDRVSLRYLRLGSPAADGRIPVLAGLAAGERVAVDPVAAALAYKQQSGSAA